MTQEMGETREAMGWGLMKLVDTWVTNLKNETKPYYLVFAAKPDVNKSGTVRQAMQAYRQRPPALLGVLVWYVDNAKGLVELVPELSSPPDIPIDPSLLSTKSEDALPTIMERGKKFNVIVS
jgi:hypothetical protein